MLPPDLQEQIFKQLMQEQALTKEPEPELDDLRSFVDYPALTGQTRLSRLLPARPFPRARQGLHHGHFRRVDWSRCQTLLWQANPGPEWVLQVKGQMSFRKACYLALTDSLSRSLDAQGLSGSADASFQLEALVRSLRGRRGRRD